MSKSLKWLVRIKYKTVGRLMQLEIILSTPGALAARLRGCYLEPYKMLYNLHAMGIKPKTILDIGANRGMFCRCAHYVFPVAAIYSFEPLKDCYEELCSLKKTIDKLECYNVALGEKDGETFMHKSGYDYSSSLLEMNELHKEAFPYSSSEQLEKVQIQTLDGILVGKVLERPVLMEIDVQGYERFVLEGGPQILQQTDYILCEMSFRSLYKEQALFEDVYKMLVSEGFRFVGHLGELRHPKTREVLQIDGLFITRAGSGRA